MMVVKPGCQTILIFIFVYQIINSLNKLQHGELGTSIVEESISSHHLPTITLCRIPTVRTLRRIHEISMEKAYQEMGIEDRRTINRLSIGNTGSLKDLDALNRNYLDPNEPLNAESSIEVHNTFMPMEGELHPCELVTIATNLSSSEMVFLEFIPSSPIWHTMIRFDNQHQFTSLGNQIFGGAQLPGSNLLPEVSSLLVLKEKVILSKSQPNRICTDSGQAKMFECTQDYLVRNMPCHLPWLPKNEDSQKRPCNETHDWIAWREGWELLYKDATYENIVKTTGCVPNCLFRKYEAKLASVSIPRAIDPLLNNSHLLVLQMPQGIVTFQTEKYFYDTSSFIADVGGFLGLLLGLSVMDIVEMVISVFKRITEITFKTKTDPVS